jgi:RimJ/RimL family protein N-acetyltransferase
MAVAFKSSRLLYRAIETIDEDIDFMHQNFRLDAQALANVDARLWKPPTRKSSKEWVEWISEKTLMSVLICLPPNSPDLQTNDESTSLAHSSTNSAPDKKPSSESKKSVPIGYVTLMNAPQENRVHHRGSEIGISIAEAYRGKGFGSEAINWITDWGFNIAGLHSVRIAHFSFNQRAGDLYERLGFVKEGRVREAFYWEGGWHDLCFLGMLEGEWRALRGKE